MPSRGRSRNRVGEQGLRVDNASAPIVDGDIGAHYTSNKLAVLIFLDKEHLITFEAKEPGLCIARMHTAVSVQLLQPRTIKSI